MRICVFGTRGFPNVQGGVETHCEQLYPRMSKKKCEVIVFRRKPYLLNSRNNYEPIRFIDLPSTRISGFEAAYHSLLCTLYTLFLRPDVVHIHNIGPSLFIPLLRLFGLKVVVTYHTPNYEHAKWNLFSQLILRLSERLVFRYAHRIIFVSEVHRQRFESTIGTKSIHIPNGVNPHAPSTSCFYLRLFGVEKKKYILSVGRITPEKGFDLLIDAFRQLGPDGYKLVIVGGEDHRSKYAANLHKEADSSADILFTGQLSGEPLRQLYSHAALFVLPSYNEAFPIVLLEALNYRLPVLASDIEGIRQINLPGIHYFKAGSVVSLKEQLSPLFTETPSQSPSYDLSPYRWDDIARRTWEVFRQVMN